MAYAYDIQRLMPQGSGGAKNISSVSSQRIILSAALSAVPIAGQLVAVILSATNDGNYTVNSVVSATNFTVAEPINNSGASGRVINTGLGVEKNTTGPAITAHADAETIQVTGALFLTNNGRIGDRIGVFGSTNNDGSYIVKEFTDEDTAKVVSRTLGANPLNPAVADGNIRHTAGYVRATLTAEATPTWTTFAANIPDFVSLEVVGSHLTLVRVAALNQIILSNSGSASSLFDSSKELIVPLRSDGDNNGITWNVGGGTTGTTIVRSGVGGSDVVSFSDGSYWMGGTGQVGGYSTALKTEVVGSILHNASLSTGTDGFFRGCLFDKASVVVPGVIPSTGGDARICIFSGGSPSSSEGGSVFQDIFVGFSYGSGFANIGSPVISDLLLGDDAFRPFLLILGATLTQVVDPKEDYLLSELFSYIYGGDGWLGYTWNPTFVERDDTGKIGAPIQGLVVHIYTVLPDGAPYFGLELGPTILVSDAQGQLNSGAGVRLIRGFTNSVSDYYATQRILIEGANYRAIHYRTTMSSPFEGDFPIDVQQTDFQGGMSVG